MKNVKDQVYAALDAVFENVTDQYPKDKEEKSYVRYRVDIWNNRSTSEAAMQVDAALSKLCLVRILCKDTPDPSGMKHKVMRYEGIIDMESEQVFWPD